MAFDQSSTDHHGDGGGETIVDQFDDDDRSHRIHRNHFQDQFSPSPMDFAHGPPPGFVPPSAPAPNGFHSWSGLTGFLMGIIPLAIIVASMVPAFVTVPVQTAAIGRRRRDVLQQLVDTKSAINDNNPKLQSVILKHIKNSGKQSKSVLDDELLVLMSNFLRELMSTSSDKSTKSKLSN